MMQSADDVARLVYLTVLFLAVIGCVLVEYRGRMSFAMRSAAAWVLIFVGVIAGFGLWNDMQDRAAATVDATPGRLTLPRGADGHYYATLRINGTEMTFLVDTGASQVVLSAADALRLGIDPATLAFLGQAQTANGMVRTARVTLPEVEAGPFRNTDVVAYVSEGDMEGSLLGMSYLGQFAVEITDGKMILRRD